VGIPPRADLSSFGGWLYLLFDAKGEVLGYLVAGMFAGFALAVWAADHILPLLPPTTPGVSLAFSALAFALAWRSAVHVNRKEQALSIGSERHADDIDSARLRERIAELEKDRDGWRTDFKRMQDANLALAAAQANAGQPGADKRAATLKQVQKVRRQRTEQAKKDAINAYIARVEQTRRDDPTWLSKRSNLDPEWTHWIRLERVPLWQAVCLSFDIDPDKLPNASAGTADLRKLMALAARGGRPGATRA
jgi:hypothetical protein